MIKALFFDSGNVLVKEGYTPGIAEYEEKHDIEKGKLHISAHDRPYWRNFTLGNITEEEYFRQLKNDFQGSLDIAELKETIYKNFIPNRELVDFIRTLKDKFILGIISNNPKEWIEYCSRTFGWSDLFAVKAVSGYLHIRKPDKLIFQRALELAKVEDNEAVYIDDRPDRIEGAQSLGIKIIIFEGVDKLKNDLNNLISNK